MTEGITTVNTKQNSVCACLGYHWLQFDDFVVMSSASAQGNLMVNKIARPGGTKMSDMQFFNV